MVRRDLAPRIAALVEYCTRNAFAPRGAAQRTVSEVAVGALVRSPFGVDRRCAASAGPTRVRPASTTQRQASRARATRACERTGAGEEDMVFPEIQTKDLHLNCRIVRECPEVRGADDEIRTRDIDLGKVALYQLSYIRTPPCRDDADDTQCVRRPAGTLPCPVAPVSSRQSAHGASASQPARSTVRPRWWTPGRRTGSRSAAGRWRRRARRSPRRSRCRPAAPRLSSSCSMRAGAEDHRGHRRAGPPARPARPAPSSRPGRRPPRAPRRRRPRSAGRRAPVVGLDAALRVLAQPGRAGRPLVLRVLAGQPAAAERATTAAARGRRPGTTARSPTRSRGPAGCTAAAGSPARPAAARRRASTVFCTCQPV